MAVKADKKALLSVVLLSVALLACIGCASKAHTDIKTAIVASSNVKRRLFKINGFYKLGATDGIQVSVANSPELSGTPRITP